MKFLPLILVFCATLHAAEIHLAWDASPSPNVTYKVYAHSSYLNPGAPLIVSNVGPVTSAALTLSNGFWFLAVTAVDATGAESLFSNVITYDNRTNATWTQSAPTIKQLRFATNSAALDWQPTGANEKFIVERSRDGVTWEAVDTSDATNKTVDAFRFSKTLYRVRSVDANNEVSMPSNVMTNERFRRLVIAQ